MFDTLLRGGLLVDGTGAAPIPGDLALKNGKIAARGDLRAARAEVIVDAAGLCVTPGFIDIHRHADAAVLSPSFGEAELRQGLTTIVNGNCGMSPFPAEGAHGAAIAAYLAPIVGTLPRTFSGLADYASALPPLPLHVGQLVGLGTIRASIAGFSPTVTDAQLRQMQSALETALSDGALGVSLGLGYAPECFFSTDALIRVLAPLQNSGLPLCVHLRQEGSGVVSALEEMLTVARALQTPLEVSHLKAIGRANRGTARQLLSLLHAAAQEGLSVGCDVYPYDFGSTQLVHVLPPEAQIGGLAALTQNLSDPSFRAHLRARMEADADFENISLLCGWEAIRVAALSSAENQSCIGKTIAALSAQTGKDPFDTLFDLLAQEHCNVTMFDTIVSEEDLTEILQDDLSCLISDSLYPSSGLLHPRVTGAFPRLIERYVQKTGLLTLEQAVRKMTALPAARLGLKDKGRLIPGLDADILLFRPEDLHETTALATGIDTVFVSGIPVLRGGLLTGQTPGRFLSVPKKLF